MKTQLLSVLTAVILLLMPSLNFAQAPPLGTAADFVLFTTAGEVKNQGETFLTLLTGNVGTNSNSTSPGFGNIDGTMYFTGNTVSQQCADDLLVAYNELDATVANFFPSSLLGNGDTLIEGVYSITGAATLNLNLILDAKGNPDAVFIFQIEGAFSTAANSEIVLINGAQACNVFWKVEGLVDMASGTFMRGTIIANNFAIVMGTGCKLEGRALSTAGAITVGGVTAYTPIGCNSPVNTGPAAPALASTECYALFTGNENLTNTGVSFITGDVGTNVGLTVGFDPLNVIGTIHEIPDVSTQTALDDLANVYNYLNLLPTDIELLYPVQLGHNLVLTPHTYILNSATVLTDTLYLDAQGDANAVFVFNLNGAFSTSTYSKVLLLNDAQAKNVFWKITGGVEINEYSIFNGSIVSVGAIDLKLGVTLNGRGLTTTGAFTTNAITATMPLGCAVAVAPEITGQPTIQTACVGDAANFSVVATGTGLTYQWRKGTVDLIDGGTISGATSATLTIDPVALLDVASSYNVVVSGTYPPNDTSINASLVVNTAPAITTQPANQIECSGSLATFSVVATGTSLTYQWRKGTVNLTNGGNILGATTATLTIDPATVLDEAVDYNVVISGTCTPSVTSANASLVISAIIALNTQPANQTECAGSPVSFSVSATGAGLTYQWRKGLNNLTNTGNITGATNATLTLDPVNVEDAALDYNVVISSTCASALTSADASLTVNSAPAITTQPDNQIECSGSLATFSVVATGTSVTYQWRKGTVNLTNTGNVLGATTATLTIDPATALDEAVDYNVVVSGTCAPSVTSANVSLVISAVIALNTQPANQTECAGSPVSFSVSATGAGLTYQWRKGLVNLSNTGNITGATTAILTLDPVNEADAALDYNVVISSTCASTLTSADASLVVNSAPAITTQPANQIECSGSLASFSVVATGTGLTYQWKKGTVNLTNTGNVLGATTATLTIDPVTALDEAVDYNVVVSGACAPDVTSTNASLTINAVPVITAEPVNQTECAGSAVSLSVTATGTDLTYQWRKGTVELTNAGTVSGATTATLTIDPVNVTDVATNYNVVVSGACTPDVTSTNTSITVNAPPVITSEPVTQTECAGSAASISVVATGTDLTYQWRKGTVELTNAGTISGATTATLTINPVSVLDVAANYNVVVSGACAPDVTSTNASLTVNAVPVITTEPVNQTECAGSSVSLLVTATGTDLTYQWRKGTVELTNAGTVSGATTATLTIDPVSVLDVATNYNVVVSGACAPAVTSTNTSITVNEAPVITAEPVNQMECAGSAVSISVTATGTDLTYQWRKGTVGLTNAGTVSGATSATLTINPVNVSDVAINYNVVVSGACAPDVTSTNASLTVNTAPVITAEPANQVVTSGSPASFSVVATGTDLTYQWRKGTVNLTNTGTVSGATSANLTIDPSDISDASTDYNVVVSGTCAPSVTSTNVSLVVNPSGIPSFVSGNQAFTVYPNPFTESIAFRIIDPSQINNCELVLFNVLGKGIISLDVTKEVTTIETNNLPSGIYFYKAIKNGKTIQTGKIICK
ncbi:MAG: ice-binding family protein [Salinivirgaceae bacterium]